MIYPFSALVGQEQLKLALLLNAINPALGGVLIRGEKGTAKSTAARALAAILPPLRAVPGCLYHCDPDRPWADCPHCREPGERGTAEMPVPFVDLPLGATEDRVVGTLDFDRALKEARRAFQPGLLAEAHRGILYIDEVNLLADHLIDVLLDAAASGINAVQREGIAFTHPARFVLIGTMNPEEGDLRPQLLDRFGLMVAVTSPRDPELRAEIVRRRLAFERDPLAFCATWAAEQRALSEKIQSARVQLASIRLDEGLLLFITRLCCAMEVDGLRADVALHKAACALAAWHGREQVVVDDIRTAAELVLPHRQRRKPFEQPQVDKQRLDELCRNLEDQHDAPAEESQQPELDDTSTEEQRFEAVAVPPVRPIDVVPADKAAKQMRGRHKGALSNGQGRYVRAVQDERPQSVAIDATVRAAVQRGGFDGSRLTISASDLHRKERAGPIGTLVVFVVDASGSMAARQRMAAVKGTVLRLLESAYEQRDQVAVIAFRGTRAEIVLAPTTSVDVAQRALHELPTGGRTPLAHALMLARQLVGNQRPASAGWCPLLVVLSDGRANVSLPDVPGDAWQQTMQAAGELAAARIPALVLDAEAGYIRLGLTQELATALGAEYLALDDLSADKLTLRIRQHLARV
jgi:magnesium chelatase subunit D